ncbi:MAG: hypothetical protein MJE63_31055 [Proteobacteria bacterium]|nr:hypothetical protein [Pseudomonadota bacterium]
MKHFFDQSTVLDDAALSELLRSARTELKKKPMNLAEMTSKMDLICFNASASDQYVPRGLDSLVTTKNMPLNQKIQKEFNDDLDKLINSSPGDVFGYLLGNIQTKNIFNYLDILFEIRSDYKFKPQVVTHFSYDELIEYLSEFLNIGVVDGVKRSIEVFDDKSPKAWKTITRSSELKSVDKAIREPVILDRPFFTDINLNITKGGRPQLIESSIGKLKSVINYFNKYRTPSGEVIASKNKLFFKPSDIQGFKVSSSQSKLLLGLSYKGEYISSAQFITHDIGLKSILFKDVDFFTFKIGKKPADLKPSQITKIEVNLDTQQMVFLRGIAPDEYHVARFNKLKLSRGEDSAYIHKAVSFNRGAANFDQIQTFFASRYTEFEKAKQILNARGELGLLSARNVCAGDLTAHITLSTMNLLGLVPFESKCLGYSPKDIKNPEISSTLFDVEIKALQDLFKNILDVSQSPDFTEHNFSRLSKNMRAFITLHDFTTIDSKIWDRLLDELEKLTDYMDNFFKISLYKDLKEDLECETVPDFESMEDGMEIASEENQSRLDEKTRQFISENYSFFKKRDLVQKATLKIEKLIFYGQNVKPFTDNPKFEPALIVYSNNKSQAENYRYASYPALSLTSVIDPGVLKNKDDNDELEFVKFMRDFTQKTFQKARELNKTFHHQYKHTLAELGFLVDEKLRQLQEELDFLERPENKEKAYQELYEKIKKMYLEHLKSKEKNIAKLKAEEEQVRKKLQVYKQSLEKLMGTTIDDANLDEFLASVPDKLEKRKAEIIAQHKEKFNEAAPVFKSYVNLHNSALGYFNKVLSYSSLFQKALWMHRHQKMIEDQKEKAKKFYHADPETIQKQINELEAAAADPEKEKTIKKEVDQLIKGLQDALTDLDKIPANDLFKDPKTPDDKLVEYLEFYRDESFRLTRLVGMLQTAYQKMNKIQNQLFKKQEELVLEQLKSAKTEFSLKIFNILRRDSEATDEIEALEEQTENIPTEIKNHLGDLRAVLIKALTAFKENITPDKLAGIANYKEFLLESKKREKINDITKELVNFSQGIKAIKKERGGEIEDLEYLKTQEAGLEKIAMSKALPSTRILLKTQYIPLVEKEKAMMERVNKFLAEIISNEKQIIDGLTDTFFRKRYGFSQFVKGSFCVDTTKGTKDHTEKNIYAAYLHLSERHKKSCSVANVKADELGMAKIEIQGDEGLKNRISQTWHKHVSDKFICLPPSLTIEEVLDLCEYKELICRNNPKPQRSQNSLILVYISKIDFEKVKATPDLLEKYNQAILSNIFLNIDDTKIYNNRDSIYEGFVKATFGASHDSLAKQISELLLQE